MYHFFRKLIIGNKQLIFGKIFAVLCEPPIQQALYFLHLVLFYLVTTYNCMKATEHGYKVVNKSVSHFFNPYFIGDIRNFAHKGVRFPILRKPLPGIVS